MEIFKGPIWILYTPTRILQEFHGNLESYSDIQAPFSKLKTIYTSLIVILY